MNLRRNEKQYLIKLLSAGFLFSAIAMSPTYSQSVTPGGAGTLGGGQAQPRQQAPAQQPRQQTQRAPAQQPQAAAQEPGLAASPWTKRCDEDPNDNAEVCQVISEIRTESGQPIAAVVVIAKEGEDRRLMRGIMPLGMAIQPGIRAVIDTNEPLQGRYTTCIQIGCFADIPGDGSLVDSLKKGGRLVIQAVNAQGRQVDLAIPLTGFTKAFDGPPVDPEVVEEQQRRLQEEMQRRAEEARERLQQNNQ